MIRAKKRAIANAIKTPESILSELRKIKNVLKEIEDEFSILKLAEHISDDDCEAEDLADLYASVWRSISSIPSDYYLNKSIGIYLDQMEEVYYMIKEQPFVPARSETVQVWDGESKYVDREELVPIDEQALEQRYEWIREVEFIMEVVQDTITNGFKIEIHVYVKHFERKDRYLKLLCDIIEDSVKGGVKV